MSKGNSPPKTIVLELRERSGTNAGSTPASNGDFTVNLAKPVTMAAGDQLALKSVFVDSVQTSQGDVVLIKDVPVSIVSGLYSCNFQTTDKQYNRGEASNAAQPDCKNYVHCRTQGQATNAKAMMSLTFHAITTNPFSKAGADAWGNIHVGFDYTPLGGTLRPTHQPIHRFHPRTQRWRPQKLHPGLGRCTGRVSDHIRREQHRRLDSNDG